MRHRLPRGRKPRNSELPLFYLYSDYLKKTFGAKTYKLVVSSGLQCPHGRCAFCDRTGSRSFYGTQQSHLPIREQIEMHLPKIKERFNCTRFLAYFQDHTNTAAGIPRLRALYQEAFSHPEILGLCIGTRPDCLPDEVLLLLEELSREQHISLELGVQSLEDPVLSWFERGHDSNTSLAALERIAKLAPHVHVCVHLIFGAPPESKTAPRETALQLNRFPIHGVKLHQLMVLKNTALADRYLQDPFPALGLETYGRMIFDFLSHLRPDIYVERLSANATEPEDCIAPGWSKERWSVHNDLRKMLEGWGLRQGSALSRLSAP